MMNRPRMRFREVIDRPGGRLGRVTAVPGPQHGWGRRGAHGASVTTTSGHADRVKVSDSRRGAGGWWPEHRWRGETLVVDRPPPLCHSACRHATISDRRGRPKMPGADGGCGLIEREDMIGPRQNGGGGDGMGRVLLQEDGLHLHLAWAPTLRGDNRLYRPQPLNHIRCSLTSHGFLESRSNTFNVGAEGERKQCAQCSQPDKQASMAIDLLASLNPRPIHRPPPALPGRPPCISHLASRIVQQLCSLAAAASVMRSHLAANAATQTLPCR
ncbi:hypothetical protein Purlil1_8319 [Purpureocillium lilacinum]|uniref:Uncharacterized protein n=2 Tax=Purpureocillium lilacinum TaxID=33203 RepID=A0ABR0BTA7_PURLI|nr:hypothetical protein Purlil1_8319 [Purpureocillium lilacinum]